MSDIYEDLRKAFNQVMYERWICKVCGNTVLNRPATFTGYIIPCSDCGNREWHYSTKKPPPGE